MASSDLLNEIITPGMREVREKQKRGEIEDWRRAPSFDTSNEALEKERVSRLEEAAKAGSLSLDDLQSQAGHEAVTRVIQNMKEKQQESSTLSVVRDEITNPRTIAIGVLLVCVVVLIVCLIRTRRKARTSAAPPGSEPEPRMPENTIIGSDGLPRLKNAKYGWGRKYNAFITPSGTHYHRGRCLELKHKYKQVVHVYDAIKKYEPCAKCNPKRKVDDWYLAYLKATKEWVSDNADSP